MIIHPFFGLVTAATFCMVVMYQIGRVKARKGPWPLVQMVGMGLLGWLFIFCLAGAADSIDSLFK